MSFIRSHRDLNVYQNAMAAAIRVMAFVRRLPKAEQAISGYQARRCCMSVCANLAEAIRRRRYPANFVSKLTDCQAEAAETQVWLEFWWREGYITEAEFESEFDAYEKILSQIVRMEVNSKRFATFSRMIIITSTAVGTYLMLH